MTEHVPNKLDVVVGAVAVHEAVASQKSRNEPVSHRLTTDSAALEEPVVYLSARLCP